MNMKKRKFDLGRRTRFLGIKNYFLSLLEKCAIILSDGIE